MCKPARAIGGPISADGRVRFFVAMKIRSIGRHLSAGASVWLVTWLVGVVVRAPSSQSVDPGSNPGANKVGTKVESKGDAPSPKRRCRHRCEESWGRPEFGAEVRARVGHGGAEWAVAGRDRGSRREQLRGSSRGWTQRTAGQIGWGRLQRGGSRARASACGHARLRGQATRKKRETGVRKA
jgi:hypothetical protein